MRSAFSRYGVAAFNGYFGAKPGRGAPKLDRLLWFRGYYLRSLPLYVVLLALIWSGFPLWLAALLVVPWLAGLLRLNRDMRRERGSG